MGQFKPMVKMQTTEPSVILKLKKGGMVQKKADGGMMMPPPGAGMPPMGMPPRGGMPMAAAPKKPSLAQRRRAMKGMPAGAGPAAPVGPMAGMMKEGGKADKSQDKAMIKKAFKQHDKQEHVGGKGTKLALKKGGKMAAGGMHMMPNGKMMKNSAMKHGGMAYATGGVVDGQGGYATGGVVNGQGGYATGGVAKANGGGYRKGGKIRKMADGGGLMDALGGFNKMTPAYDGKGGGGGGTAMSGLGDIRRGTSTTEGAVSRAGESIDQANAMNSMASGALGVGGGGGGGGGPHPMPVIRDIGPEIAFPYGKDTAAMKRGGKASKKAYAAGGTVNSGRPVAMKQGSKPAGKPISIIARTGAYKAGGQVAPGNRGLQGISEGENAPAYRAASNASSYKKGGSASSMKFKSGGSTPSEDMSKGAYDAHYANEKAENEAMRNMILDVPKRLYKGVKGLFESKPPVAGVTKTKESVTVTPAKKRGGSVKC
jgi:hypothetical protein